MPGTGAMKTVLRWREWWSQRAFVISALLGCVALTVLIMLAAWWYYSAHSRVEHLAQKSQASNMALALEIHARDTLLSVDDAVRRIKQGVEREGTALNLRSLMEEFRDIADYVAVASVADAQGRLIMSTLPVPPGTSIADLAHFRHHVGQDSGEPFFGKPVIGRVSGKWSFHVTRRINKPDGGFAGVAIVAADFSYWSTVLKEGDFGEGAVIALVGRDGFTRALHGDGDARARMNETDWSFLLREADAGRPRGLVSVDQGAGPGLWSYRALSGYPMVVAVGLSGQGLERRLAVVRSGLLSGVLAFALLALLLSVALMRAQARQRAYATERSRISGVLRQSEERFRLAFDQAAVGMAMRPFGRRDLPWQKVNQKFCDFLGYSEAELLELTPARVHDPEEERISAEAESRLARGEIASYGREKQYIRKDGRRVWGQVTVTVLHYPDGQPAQTLNLIEDIDVRKRAEAALRESESRFRAIFEHAGLGITVRNLLDRRSPWIAVNDKFCEMTGYSRDELMGMSTYQLSEAEDNAIAEATNVRLRSGEQRSYTRQKRICRKDGEFIWTELTMATLPDDGGRPERVIGIYQDITARKTAEERARRGEVQFKAVFDHAGVGISVRPAHDRRLPYLAVNDRFCELTGYSREELLRLSTSDLTREQDQEIAARDNSSVLSGVVNTYGREKALVCKGGALRWVALSVAILPDETGQPQRIMSTYQDIHARKVAEARLRESEGRLRAVIAAEPECVATVSPEGELLEMNPAGLRMLEAKSLEELQRLPFLQLVLPEYRRAFVRLQYRIRAGNTGMLEFETRGLRGKRRWLQIHAAPLYDDTGRITALLGIARDITEQRQAQQAVAAERNLLRTVIDNLPDRIRVKDRELRYVLANAAWLDVRAKGRRDIVGLTNRDFLPPQSVATHDAEDRAVIATGQPSAAREVVDGTPDNPRFFVTTKTPLRDAAGRIDGLVAISRDVTDFKRRSLEVEKLNAALEGRVAERTVQLTNANEELEAFASSVSHDLRAPLRSIDGLAAVLLEDGGDRLDEQERGYVARIRAAAARMAGLIEDLLRLSRVSRAELKVEQVDLTALAQGIVEELRREQPQRRVQVNFGSGLLVRGDAGLLRAALSNLLHNAWKFTARAEAPRIEFGCSINHNQLNYFVRDNGAGFDMAQADRLFSAFQRLHADSDFPGTGIGLATVRRIIRRHGGDIWATSAPGAGATFQFTLGSRPASYGVPRLPATMQLAAEPEPPSQPSASERPCVLLVDDDPDVLTLTARALRPEGYVVMTAASGEEGLKLLREHRADIVVSDFSMPGMNGAQFLARVKALYPDTLRLIVSGQTMNRAMQSGLRKGDIHLFFEKQRSFDPVRQCIRDWLGARRPQD